jgi:transposase
VQYRAIRYGQTLAQCEAVASVGSKEDLLSASLWPRPSTPCTRPSSSFGQGPWEGIDAVELATAQWAHWYNTVRPHSAIGMHTPIQHEQTRPLSEDSTDTENTDQQAISQPQPATTGAR